MLTARIRVSAPHRPPGGLSHGSLAVVFVVPPEPVERVVVVAGFVAPPRCAVEPLVHAPEAVEPARVGGVGVVDDAVLERERAHAGSLLRVGRPVRAGRGGPLGEWPLAAGLPGRLQVERAEVVLTDSRLLLFLAVAGLEVGVEVGAEHEVVDEQLRPPAEQVGQRRGALVGVEHVLLVEADPWELLPHPGQLLAAARQLLLGREQLQPRREPFLPGSGLVIGHRPSFLGYIDGVSPGTDAGARMIQIPSPRIATATGTSIAALAGSSFWARTTAAMIDIQTRLMTPSATSISISPMLEPTQQRPNPSPERMLSRQRWRKRRLSSVSS